MWKLRLNPLVKSGDYVEPLTERYEAFTETVLLPESPAHEKYREKLLGPDLIAGHNPDYVLLKTIDQVGHDRWEKLTIEERGKWAAFYELENMAELLKEHLRLKKQEAQERSRKLK